MNTKVRDESAGKRPFNHIAGVGRTNRDWWPNQVRLELKTWGKNSVQLEQHPFGPSDGIVLFPLDILDTVCRRRFPI